MPWPQECDFPPVVEASFNPIEGVPENEEPHNHATSFGLVRALLEHGEESEEQGVVYLFHPAAFEEPHWEVLGYCVRKKSYETARAFPPGRGRGVPRLRPGPGGGDLDGAGGTRQRITLWVTP